MRFKYIALLAIFSLFWMPTVGGIFAQTGTMTVFVDVHLVPMTHEAVVSGQSVRVEGTRIAAVGPPHTVEIPDHAVVIDGAGRYLMPGLADMHVHTDTRWLDGSWPVGPLDLFLANGVTTIRDFGPRGEPEDYALDWRREIARGRLRGPTIYAAGPILYGPVKDAGRVVRQQKQTGFDFVKLYSFLSAAEFCEAVAAARSVGIYTAGHIPFAVGLDGVLAEGMDEIAHIEELDFEFLDFDRTRNLSRRQWFRYIIQAGDRQWAGEGHRPPARLDTISQGKLTEVIGKLKTAEIPLCTTLALGDLVVDKLFYAHRLCAGPVSAYLPSAFLTALRQGKDGHQFLFKDHENFARFHRRLNRMLLRELHAAGICLVLGTDAGGIGMGLVPGFSVHDELQVLVDNGFSPFAAMCTATVNAAAVVRSMGKPGDFGTIETGRRADLILVEKSPLADIGNLKSIFGVMAAGRWYDRADLNRMIRTEDFPKRR